MGEARQEGLGPGTRITDSLARLKEEIHPKVLHLRSYDSVRLRNESDSIRSTVREHVREIRKSNDFPSTEALEEITADVLATYGYDPQTGVYSPNPPIEYRRWSGATAANALWQSVKDQDTPEVRRGIQTTIRHLLKSSAPDKSPYGVIQIAARVIGSTEASDVTGILQRFVDDPDTLIAELISSPEAA